MRPPAPRSSWAKSSPRRLKRDLKKEAKHGREGDTGARPAKQIGFHAIRGGDIVGEHTVIFAGAGERVEVTVRSQSRMTYALGALRAAKFLRGKRAGPLRHERRAWPEVKAPACRGASSVAAGIIRRSNEREGRKPLPLFHI